MRPWLASLLLALLAPVAAVAAPSKTWAIFDSQRAMEATSHFKDAKAALEKELEKRQEVLEKRKKGLEEQREALEAQKAVAVGTALVEQEAKLAQEEQELAQSIMMAQRELALFEQKLKEQLFMRLEAAVHQIAESGSHTFVVDAGKVLYHVPKLDITDAVIEVYNQRFSDKPLDLSAVKLGQGPGLAPAPRAP